MNVLETTRVTEMIVEANKADSYMSTRISTSKAGTYEDNVALAMVREQQLDARVLNPARINTQGLEHWGDVEYMDLWCVLIQHMHDQGKSMTVYSEDHAYSKGCKAEYKLAQDIKMRIVDGDVDTFTIKPNMGREENNMFSPTKIEEATTTKSRSALDYVSMHLDMLNLGLDVMVNLTTPGCGDCIASITPAPDNDLHVNDCWSIQWFKRATEDDPCEDWGAYITSSSILIADMLAVSYANLSGQLDALYEHGGGMKVGYRWPEDALI